MSGLGLLAGGGWGLCLVLWWGWARAGQAGHTLSLLLLALGGEEGRKLKKKQKKNNGLGVVQVRETYL